MTFTLIFNETSNSGKKRFPLPKGHVKVFLSRAYQRCYWRTSFKLGFRSLESLEVKRCNSLRCAMAFAREICLHMCSWVAILHDKRFVALKSLVS